MISVEVRNFQSIENVSIQIDGFTALVGRSNIGKSALVRAMKAALTNELGTSFVRHDRTTCARYKGGKTCKCFTSVHITIGEVFDLLWEKGDSINRYTFNGQQYDKPGQGTPDFLLENGLAPVKVGDNWETLQVADQFFPIFLLNQSGPAAAEAISDVARLDKISAAMKLADKDKREAQSTRRVRGRDVIELEAKLAAYDGLDTACAKADAVEAAVRSIDACAVRITALGGYIGATQDLVAEVRSLADIVRVKVPTFSTIEDAWHVVEEQASFYGRLLEVGAEFRRLSSVKVGDLPEVEPVAESLEQVRTFDIWLGKLRSLRTVFDSLDGIGKIQVPAVDSVVDAQKNVKSLTNFERRLSAVVGAVKRLEAELATTETEEAEVQEAVDALGVCPTCSQPVTEHVHA